MAGKLKQRFLVDEVCCLSSVGDSIEFLGRKMKRSPAGHRLTTSSCYIDQCLIDMNIVNCTRVSTPSHHVTEKDWTESEQGPQLALVSSDV